MAFRILIAEDDSLLANAMQEELTKKGYILHMATNGNEVLSLVKAYDFDLLLTDLIMPQLDGFQLIQQLSTHGFKAPIAVLTNLMQPNVLHQLEEMKIDRHFIKSDTSLEDILHYVQEKVAGHDQLDKQ